MTFPTEEDIEIVKFTTPVLHIEKIGEDYLNSEKAESLKQQILNDHEIVERLKEKIKQLESMQRDDGWFIPTQSAMQLLYLTEILEDKK